MADRNDSLLREVEEELRREQYARLWDKYGMYVLGAAALVLVVVGGYKVWESRRIAAEEAAGAKYEEAVKAAAAQAGKEGEAAKAFEAVASSGPKGFSTLAKLQMASAFAKAGKTAEAVEVYETLGKDVTADPLFRDFGRLQAANLRLGQADWTEMQNRLNDLAADNGSWRYSAKELLGVAAFKAGKLDEARRMFEVLLRDPKTPPGLAERSRNMMASIVAAERAQGNPQDAGAKAPATTSTEVPGSQAPGGAEKK